MAAKHTDSPENSPTAPSLYYEPKRDFVRKLLSPNVNISGDNPARKNRSQSLLDEGNSEVRNICGYVPASDDTAK
jgi:hypothetical protein